MKPKCWFSLVKRTPSGLSTTGIRKPSHSRAGFFIALLNMSILFPKWSKSHWELYAYLNCRFDSWKPIKRPPAPSGAPRGSMWIPIMLSSNFINRSQLHIPSSSPVLLKTPSIYLLDIRNNLKPLLSMLKTSTCDKCF